MKTASVAYSVADKGQGKREDWGERSKISEVSAGSSGLVYSWIGMSITVTGVSTCAVVMWSQSLLGYTQRLGRSATACLWQDSFFQTIHCVMSRLNLTNHYWLYWTFFNFPVPMSSQKFPIFQEREGEWTSPRTFLIQGVPIHQFFTPDPAVLYSYIVNFETRAEDVFVVSYPKSGM